MRLAALDLGSNSFHLLVAEVHPDGTFEAVATDKEMLRLGSQVAATGEIGPLKAKEAIETVRRYKALADSLGAQELVACATAAFREARDSLEVVDAIEEQAKVKVRVISGKEEARLIFEAVRAAVVLDPPPALCMDLGGGSLELAVGDAAGMSWSASLKLGVARLTAELVRSDPPSGGDCRRVVNAVRKALSKVAPEIASLRPRFVVATSGTLLTLLRLAAAERPGGPPLRLNQLSVSHGELERTSRQLLRITSAERAALPGVDARRADLLPAGALLLTTVLELVGLDRVVGCEWALREGMVLDAIGKHSRAELEADPRAIRRESVLGLCRRCNYNEVHATKVARLALELFDGMAGIHHLGPQDRELLEYGALMHDIGEHVSTDGHERHSAYLIQNGRLRGFSPLEVDLLACMGRFHKRGSPKPSFDSYARLPESQRRRVGELVAILQVADGLDRSHGGPVRDISVYADSEVVEVVVEADDDIDLERWGLRRKKDLFEKVFSCRLEVVDAQLELALDADSLAQGAKGSA